MAQKTYTPDEVLRKWRSADPVAFRDESQNAHIPTIRRHKKWKLVVLNPEDLVIMWDVVDQDVVDSYKDEWSKAPPIVAVPHEFKKGKWKVLDGNHRAAAAQQEQLAGIGAFVPADTFKEKVAARYTILE